MRRAMVMLAAAMLMVGMARAQMLDPSTGMLVDPSVDPFDYSAVASGQAGNLGMEVAMQAQAQSQKDMAAQQAQSDADFRNSLNNSPASEDASADNSTPPAPVIPTTPKPTLTPNGGKVAAGVSVALNDSDPNALLFYTTDGKKPTAASTKYVAPFVVTGKEKVEVLAFDLNEKPAAVVSKTFEVKK